MEPVRSSSAPSAARLQNCTTTKRRPPHHITRNTPPAARDRTDFGRHPVIPPLGQPWPKPPQNTTHMHTRRDAPHTPVLERPVPAAPQQRRQLIVTPTIHHRRNRLPSQVTFTHFPFHTPLHGTLVLPGYNYPPVMYPPTMPYIPSMSMHPQFMPLTVPPTLPHYMPAAMSYPPFMQGCAPLFPQPIVQPEITELSPRESNDYENREQLQAYEVQLLQEAVSEDVCRQLIESCLDSMVREVVNSCFDDIIRNYLGSSRVLVAGHGTGHRAVAVKRPSTHPTLHLAGLGGADVQPSVVQPSGVKYKGLERHSKLLELESDAEVSHYLSTMLLDELILSQLLHSLCDGGLGMTLRMQAQHTLNGLIFDRLLERLCQ